MFILMKTKAKIVRDSSGDIKNDFIFVASFIDIIHRANLEPEKKYRQPQTTNQEIGWFHDPLVSDECFLLER